MRNLSFFTLFLFHPCSAQLFNGSFESGNIPSLSGWTIPCTCGDVTSTAVVPGGTGTWGVRATAESGFCGCPVTFDLYQPVTWMTAGVYVLSYWARGHNGFGPPAGVKVVYRTGLGFPPLNGNFDGITGTDWTYHEEVYNYDGISPPADSLLLVISAGAADDGPFYTYFDDIRLQPYPTQVNFKLRAALDGALPSGTLMTDGLRSAGLIPMTEPYSALGYTYTGSAPGASIGSSSLLTITGNDAIVDWVVVELRNNSAPYAVVYSRPALLQRDGDIISPNGSTYLSCPVPAATYCVALRHRNHLGIMTANGISLTGTPVTVDLRVATTPCYGTNARVLKGTVHCLWAGDADGNGSVKYTGTGNDRDLILQTVGSTTPNNVVGGVYNRRDLNLDGQVKYTGTANDRDIILTTVGSTTPNNVRAAQLP
jgi:hypothetical protein